MNCETIESNFVIVTRNVELGAIDQMWLFEKKICSRDDLRNGKSIVLPGLIQINSEKYQISCMPNKINISVKGSKEEKNDMLKTKGFQFLVEETLQPTALAFNFMNVLHVEEEYYHDYCRKTLMNSSCPVLPFFNDDNSRYGAYFSADHDGFRLKLDIKPIRIAKGEVSKEAISMSFNFHHDITYEMSEEKAHDILGRYISCANLSDKISDSMIAK